MGAYSNKAKRPWWKPSIGAAIVLVLFGLWWGVPTFLKWRADEQVKELCAKDGGVKVYETVTLPSEKFDKWGLVAFRPIDGENALGSDYKYVASLTFIKRGHPDLIRQHDQIIRRSDNKLLGEAVSYSRRGGDPIGPWVGSHFSCPPIKDAGSLKLIREIFRADERGEKK